MHLEMASNVHPLTPDCSYLATATISIIIMLHTR